MDFRHSKTVSLQTVQFSLKSEQKFMDFRHYTKVGEIGTKSLYFRHPMILKTEHTKVLISDKYRSQTSGFQTFTVNGRTGILNGREKREGDK